MPVYNGLPFLEQAVASVFAQTFDDWEFIAVDDASTDESWEYLQRIDDPRVRLAHNSKNMNQSYTQNRGHDMARGRYIVRMDADDVMMPTRIEKQVAALEKNPEIDILGCGTFLTDRDMNLVVVRRPPTTHTEITRWATLNFPLTHGALAGKIEWFRRWRTDKRIRLAQDFDLLFRAHLQSTYANVAEPLYAYRFIGHTKSLKKMITSVHYKAKSLWLNGFRMGLPGKTLLGLASLTPRPLLYAIKSVAGSQTGLTSKQGLKPSDTDVQALKAFLAEIARVEVPLVR